MRKWIAGPLGVVTLLFAGGGLLAQPTVEDLQRELSALRDQMTKQREEFQSELAKLQQVVEGGLKEALQAEVEKIVADKSKFYRRPRYTERGFDDLFVFDAVKGGLIFTGLFRSRFEFRHRNADFTSSSSGLDDSGVRFNGRFRLGFGAVMVREGPTDPVITALTEFQAVGQFSNNTFFSFPGPNTIPLPSEFTIFREPFEEVTIYQGYLRFDRLLAENIFIRTGRQEVVFGNEFILGNNEFYDGTVHDGIVFEWAPGDLSISLFYLKQSQSDSTLAGFIPVDDFDEDYLAGAYVKAQATDNLVLEGYGTYFDGRSNFTDSLVTRSTAFAFDGAWNPAILGHFWTLGARVFWYELDFLGGKLGINAEAAYQTGSNGLVNTMVGNQIGPRDQTLHGWATEAIINWWIDPDTDLNPILTLGYYWAQGGDADRTPNDGLYNPHHVGFQPLFINRHWNPSWNRQNFSKPYYPGGARYGNMDLIPLNNVHVVKAALSISPAQDIELGVAYLLAITADNEGYGTGIFGHEVDLFASYKYNDNIQFAAALGLFFPQKTAEDMSQFLFFPPAAPGIRGDAGDEIAIAFYMQAVIEF